MTTPYSSAEARHIAGRYRELLDAGHDNRTAVRMAFGDRPMRESRCPECDGDGYIEYDCDHSGPYSVAGDEATRECDECGGTGVIEVEVEALEDEAS
jgi:rubrerythrin